MAVPGSVGRCSTVMCVRCRWYSCVVCVPPGLAAVAGRQVAFRASEGLPGASVVAEGAVLLLLLSLVSGSGLMLLLWLHLELFHVVCVALFPPPQCAFGVSCRGWLLGALFVSSYSCVVGPRSWAGFCAFWGFLPLFALFHLFPLFVSL